MNLRRDIVGKLRDSLKSEKILLVSGPRQSGKTTALKQLRDDLVSQKKECFYFTLEDRDFLNLLNGSPKNLFRIVPVSISEKVFVFIDEIQYLDDPSAFLKYIYDEHQSEVQLIVSGSSSFYIDRKFKDSLAGRKKIFSLYTLSFKEFLIFKGEDKIAEAVGPDMPTIFNEKAMSYLMEYFLYGGYPEVVLAPISEKKEILRELAYSYIKKDIFESGIMNDDVFYRIFKTLSSQSGALLNISELARTLNVGREKVEASIEVMRKSFHVSLVTPFYSNMRKEITKMPKIYFNDTGLMNFFAGSFDPVDLRNDKGKIFETAVFRALLESCYFDQIHFWRTQDGKEVDFVIPELKKAYEVKYSTSIFKLSKTKAFREQYADIELKYVSVERKTQNRISVPFFDLIPKS